MTLTYEWKSSSESRRVKSHQSHLTLMMTSAQVVETSVTTTDNSPSQDYTHPQLHYYMLPPGSNHLLYKMYLLPFPGHNNFLGLEENWDLRVFLQRQCSLIQNFLCHYCFLTDYTTSIKKQYNTSQRTVNKYSKQSERSVAICAESKWSFEKR